MIKMSPEDHELVKKAARRAGLVISWESERYGHRDEPSIQSGYRIVGQAWDNHGLLLDWWNPLYDDGDALRLAVQCLPFYTLKYTREDWEYCDQDGVAATRRAIVRRVVENNYLQVYQQNS